jgi:hypothetical protein
MSSFNLKVSLKYTWWGFKYLLKGSNLLHEDSIENNNIKV